MNKISKHIVEQEYGKRFHLYALKVTPEITSVGTLTYRGYQGGHNYCDLIIYHLLMGEGNGGSTYYYMDVEGSVLKFCSTELLYVHLSFKKTMCNTT